ncbi:3-hydroxyacyl-CoA dehydrogenase NAD-binding domain-containing protein [Streptomyces sp. NPDC048603]|uniref:3-hydroxyacyl-CoA dehydrogenase NAD-binding domain-containing protein n=1 Tax=Streptomyces sp. NPDC048603 TaxID=3365577 RepID=UPI00371D3A4A
MKAGIRTVGVVGGDRMGAGIAAVCARAGLDTVVCEAGATAARAARERVAVPLHPTPAALADGAGGTARPKTGRGFLTYDRDC